jgi:hypothetical protein
MSPCPSVRGRPLAALVLRLPAHAQGRPSEWVRLEALACIWRCCGSLARDRLRVTLSEQQVVLQQMRDPVIYMDSQGRVTAGTKHATPSFGWSELWRRGTERLPFAVLLIGGLLLLSSARAAHSRMQARSGSGAGSRGDRALT